jgi:[ribosomal protein S5]-alanine N-acetyltransferase
MEAIQFDLSPNLSPKRREALNLTPLPYKGRGWGLGLYCTKLITAIIRKIMTTDAVILRLEKVTEEHAQILYSCISNPHLYEYLEESIPTLIEVKQKFKFAALEKSPDNQTMIWLKWVAINRQNQYVGIVEIGIFDDQYAEMGFMTFVGFQKQGYAPLYCSLAIAESQKRFSLTVLYASVNEHNIASRKVVEKLGFELHKINQNAEFIKGKLADELIYRLTF